MEENCSSSLGQDFRFDLHKKFFQRCLTFLPARCESLENSRLTVAFYCVAGSDLIEDFDEKNRTEIIEWIYHLQWISNEGPFGFRGSTCSITSRSEINQFDRAHVTMTMTGLLTLLILGDDFRSVERKKIASSLRFFQKDNGAFLATPLSTENDLRFVYCACVIAFVLDDWSGIDRKLCEDFILSCRSYEFAFGQVPGAEAHGGSTFCAVAALHLLGVLDRLEHREQLIRWCLFRQNQGFNGRPNKPDDSCYSWWILATLKLLSTDSLVDRDSNEIFLHQTESKNYGGFSKWADLSPDPLHSYLSLASLSLLNNRKLKSIHPALILSNKAFEHLRSLQEKWKIQQ